MLQLGMNITLGSADTLKKVQPSDLHAYIRNGTFDLKNKIDQLHRILALDVKKYHELKKQLPYFTCGIFHPPVRRTENFAFLKYFILDLDHLNSKSIDPEDLKAKLSEDDQVRMIFTSPSRQGLKVMFELTERFTDPVKYSMFYKVFALKYAEENGLEQIIDSKTCDVTRACFLSYDPEIFYRDTNLPVNPASYIDFESAMQLMEVSDYISSASKENEQEQDAGTTQERDDLTKEMLASIRLKLNPKAKIRQEKDPFVPERLNALEALIKEKASELGISVTSKNINYGKQLTFTINMHWGELNVFYGKKGYSIVKSSKTGCKEEINDIAYQLVSGLLF